jgi:outer membrane autotransporter protein
VTAAVLDSQAVGNALFLGPVISGSGAGLSSSQYSMSGYRWRGHDGYDVSTSASSLTGKGPGFDEGHAGLTLAARYDATSFFGLTDRSVTLGLMANYTHSDISVDAGPFAPTLSKLGSADVDSWSLGTYGLVTDGQRYGLVTVTGTLGETETRSNLFPIRSDFRSAGIATSAMAGWLIPVGKDAKVDFRGGLNYAYASGDDHKDSIGLSYMDDKTQEFSGTVSVRIFGTLQAGEGSIRPFVQTGLTHRFQYENSLKIQNVDVSFNDADTSVFARTGFDFNLGATTQAYVAVRGDASQDYRSVEGQVGLTFKLD